MKHIITVETKKEIEINYPHYFRVEKEGGLIPNYYAAVSENYCITLYSMKDIMTCSIGSVILTNVESVGYVEISEAEFAIALEQTYKNIQNEYSKQLGL
jgi:hypothetical protein